MIRYIGFFLTLTIFAAGCAANLPEENQEAAANSPANTSSTNNNSDPATLCTEPFADYRVTFNATWSASTHPYEFPSDPHFSSLIGGTHNEGASFWQEGAAASQGIEDMAERGRTSPLDEEIESAISRGDAFDVIRGSGLGDSPGITSVEFRVTREFPLVTLVSMIAPSPDWFVGVSGLALCENQAWTERKTVLLYTYDAGTDGGQTYSAADLDLNPQDPIEILLDEHFSENGEAIPVGTFIFVRL